MLDALARACLNTERSALARAGAMAPQRLLLLVFIASVTLLSADEALPSKPHKLSRIICDVVAYRSVFSGVAPAIRLTGRGSENDILERLLAERTAASSFARGHSFSPGLQEEGEQPLPQMPFVAQQADRSGPGLALHRESGVRGAPPRGS